MGIGSLLKVLGYNLDADLGGCWEYIKRYATKPRIEVMDACGKVLQRTCEAVALGSRSSASVSVRRLM